MKVQAILLFKFFEQSLWRSIFCIHFMFYNFFDCRKLNYYRCDKKMFGNSGTLLQS